MDEYPDYPFKIELTVPGFIPSRAAVEEQLEAFGDIVVEDRGAGTFIVHSKDEDYVAALDGLAICGLFSPQRR